MGEKEERGIVTNTKRSKDDDDDDSSDEERCNLPWTKLVAGGGRVEWLLSCSAITQVGDF